MPKSRRRSSRRDDREIIAPFAAFVALIVGYFVAEGSLAAFAHQFHWMAAFAAATLAYFAVLLWYARRPRHRL